MTNTKNSFDGSIGTVRKPITALADDGTVTVDFSEYLGSDVTDLTDYAGVKFLVQMIDDSGNVTALGATNFTAVYDVTTGVLTLTNVTGGAFTGEAWIFVNAQK